LHHVICRGIERRRIFWEDSDRDDFLKWLETILTETQTPCYAWALMPKAMGGHPIQTGSKALMNKPNKALYPTELRL
jgi:hypothetical protein